MNFLQKRTMSRLLLLVLATGIAGLYCRLEVPIREMTQAKGSITRAGEVKADKYAPTELKQSQDALIQTHVHVQNDDLDKAKSEVDKSYKLSQEAISKSLPLLSKDTLEKGMVVTIEPGVYLAGRFGVRTEDTLAITDNSCKRLTNLDKDSVKVTT